MTDYSSKNYIMCVQDTRMNTKTRNAKLMQSFPVNIHAHRRVFATQADSTHTGGVATILPKKIAKNIRQVYAPTPQILLVVYRSMNDQTVGILNVYLKSKATNEAAEIERKMIETIIINTQTLYPNITLMIAGDFNARPESKRHKKLHRTLEKYGLSPYLPLDIPTRHPQGQQIIQQSEGCIDYIYGPNIGINLMTYLMGKKQHTAIISQLAYISHKERKIENRNTQKKK